MATKSIVDVTEQKRLNGGREGVMSDTLQAPRWRLRGAPRTRSERARGKEV